MTLELISSNRCPFVMRSIIALEHKKVPYTMTFVDPYDPPAWFSDISPLGKVPVLKVDEDNVLFESAVINEYLDETTPGQLHPEDPLLRARNRAWIEFGGSCLSNSFKLMAVETEEEFNSVREALVGALTRIEAELDDKGPYFNGEKFSLIDAAYAPLFIRLDILEALINTDVVGNLPKVQNWRKSLMVMPEMEAARFPGLKDRFVELMSTKNGFAKSLMAA